MKKIFIDTSKTSWCNNVCVGGKFTSDYSYAIGYWEAADILVEKALTLKSPYKDRLFYPICFNYRHFIELCLKELIISAENFYKKSECLGYEEKTISKYRSKELNETHSLEKLLNWLKDDLSCISKETFSQDISSLIIEFHNIDPEGEMFRYSISKRNRVSFPAMTYFDLKKIKQSVDKIGNYFMGIDAWIGNYNSMAVSMLESMENL